MDTVNIVNFDWLTYINNYDDLINANINTKELAWSHWIKYGKKEGRTFKNIVVVKDDIVNENIDVVNEKFDITNIFRENNNINTIYKYYSEVDYKYMCEDILIYCCNFDTLAHIYNLNLLNQKFQKIFIVVDSDICEEKYLKYNVNFIKSIKTKNYFLKFLLGIKEVMNENYFFNNLWLINDNILLKNYNDVNFAESIKKTNKISLLFKNNNNSLDSNFIILNEKYVYKFGKYLLNQNLNTNQNINNISKDITNVLYKNDVNYLFNEEKLNKYIYILTEKYIIDNNFYSVNSKYFNNIFYFFLNSAKFKNIYEYFYDCKYTKKSKCDSDTIYTDFLISNTIFSYSSRTSIRNNKFFCDLCEKFNCDLEYLINSLKVINFVRKYSGKNNDLLNLNNIFFRKSEIKTTFLNLKENIKNIQQISGNKKLIYTHNNNYYDLFWDIDDCYVEKDIDYIYISNVFDEGSCKNFKHVFCSIDNEDDFYVNRKIKFDKTLYDCYDYVLYVDSNIYINSKLKDFFDLLNTGEDLLLFSHPERNSVLQELVTLNNTNVMHNKWNLNKNMTNAIFNNFKNNVENKLYWLSVQLSTTKKDIFSDIEKLYVQYKLKRDQIYFSLIQHNYKIKIINIKSSHNFSNDIFDGDYGFIENWSCYFNRPLGGNHI